MNPQLHIELNCDDRYVNLVEQGVDVAIRMGKLSDSTLGSAYLGLNPWVLVASPDYLSEHGTPQKPVDLNRHNALIYSPVQGDDRWILTTPDGKTHSIVMRGRLRSNNLSTLLAAARQGFGIAALPLYVAHTSLAQKAIVPLLQEGQLPHQEVHAVFPSPRLLPAKVKLLQFNLNALYRYQGFKEFTPYIGGGPSINIIRITGTGESGHFVDPPDCTDCVSYDVRVSLCKAVNRPVESATAWYPTFSSESAYCSHYTPAHSPTA